jgi:cytochrome P450
VSAVAFDPFVQTSAPDPHPVYRALRDGAPLHRCEERDLFVLSRHADVRAAVLDPATYSSAQGVIPSGFVPEKPILISSDPPTHTRLRKAVQRALTPRRVAELEPRIRGFARRLLDALPFGEEVDLVAGYTQPLPMFVMSELLGVPMADRPTFRRWAEAVVHTNQGSSAAIEAAQRELYAYFAGVVAERRTRPREDLIGILLAPGDEGETLEPDEILGFCFLLLLAGIETTTAALGNAAAILDRERAARASLLGDPGRIPAAVEEALRYDSPVQGLTRTLTRPVELHGRRLAPGERVHLLFAAANRDERCFAEPDRFEPRRDPNPHLAFGFGVHFCLGASLARLELRIGLEELLARAPRYEVADGKLERVRSDTNRIYARLPVALA